MIPLTEAGTSVNISNALTLGLPKELGLVGNQPNIALTIFFVPYVVFEIPSNILLKRLKPHVWCKSTYHCNTRVTANGTAI